MPGNAQTLPFAPDEVKITGQVTHRHAREQHYPAEIAAGHARASAAADLPTTSGELSGRELEVASLATRGYTNAEIGAALQISVRTVETHKAHVMKKLGLKTRAQLVGYAICRGWLRA